MTPKYTTALIVRPILCHKMDSWSLCIATSSPLTLLPHCSLQNHQRCLCPSFQLQTTRMPSPHSSVLREYFMPSMQSSSRNDDPSIALLRRHAQFEELSKGIRIQVSIVQHVSVCSDGEIEESGISSQGKEHVPRETRIIDSEWHSC